MLNRVSSLLNSERWRPIAWVAAVFSLALIVVAVLVFAHRSRVIVLYEEVRSVADIVSEMGFAYKAPLGIFWMSSHEGPSSALVLEDGKPLGMGNAYHDEIRTKGMGRFSFWHDTLYFSASDNSDPRTNNKSYEVKWPVYIRRRIAYPIYALGLAALLFSSILVLPGIKRRWAKKRESQTANQTQGREDPSVKERGEGGATTRNTSFIESWVMKGILAFISIAVTVSMLEIFFRFYNPTQESLEQPTVPNTWTQELGWIYEANKEFDYWVWSGGKKAFTTTQKVNAWGFTDQPVPLKWPKDGLRIMILGDSFAEALQVEMDKKFGLLLESSLQKNLSMPVEVVTLGRSGTGQVNQYAFWKKYAPIVNPQVLVLVFIQNDLRDNHPELSARYYKWNPLHPPRLYFMLSDEGADGLVAVPVDKDWQFHASILPPDPSKTLMASLATKSRMVDFMVKRIGSDVTNYPWNLNYKGHNVDNAFFAQSSHGDPVIQSGYMISERILKKFKSECKARGTRLVFLVGTPVALGQERQGSVDFGMFFRWIKGQADALRAGYLSIPERMAQKGLEYPDVTAADGHWNDVGHDLAKELLEDFITSKKKEILSK